MVSPETRVRGNSGPDNRLEQTWLIRLPRKTLRRVHMNLVDFARCKSQGRIPRHFKSSGALAQYIKPSGDRFPLNLAKQNVFLKALLREVR
jgi:hypothetical protein